MTLEATPARMAVSPWRDQGVELNGHRPGSAYIEHVYLGLLGPSATWLWMRSARVATRHPGTSIDMVDLAQSLGLGEKLGPNSAISRTIARLAWFDVVHREGDRLAVRLALPDIPAHRQTRLSVSARLAHHHLAIASQPVPVRHDGVTVEVTL